MRKNKPTWHPFSLKAVLTAAAFVSTLAVAHEAYAIPPPQTIRPVGVADGKVIIEVGPGTSVEQVIASYGKVYQNSTGKELTWEIIHAENPLAVIPVCKFPKDGFGYNLKDKGDTSIWEGCENRSIALIAGPSGQLRIQNTKSDKKVETFVEMKKRTADQDKCSSDRGCADQKVKELGGFTKADLDDVEAKAQAKIEAKNRDVDKLTQAVRDLEKRVDGLSESNKRLDKFLSNQGPIIGIVMLLVLLLGMGVGYLIERRSRSKADSRLLEEHRNRMAKVAEAEQHVAHKRIVLEEAQEAFVRQQAEAVIAMDAESASRIRELEHRLAVATKSSETYSVQLGEVLVKNQALVGEVATFEECVKEQAAEAEKAQAAIKVLETMLRETEGLKETALNQLQGLNVQNEDLSGRLTQANKQVQALERHRDLTSAMVSPPPSPAHDRSREEFERMRKELEDSKQKNLELRKGILPYVRDLFLDVTTKLEAVNACKSALALAESPVYSSDETICQAIKVRREQAKNELAKATEAMDLSVNTFLEKWRMTLGLDMSARKTINDFFTVLVEVLQNEEKAALAKKAPQNRKDTARPGKGERWVVGNTEISQRGDTPLPDSPKDGNISRSGSIDAAAELLGRQKDHPDQDDATSADERVDDIQISIPPPSRPPTGLEEQMMAQAESPASEGEPMFPPRAEDEEDPEEKEKTEIVPFDDLVAQYEVDEMKKRVDGEFQQNGSTVQPEATEQPKAPLYAVGSTLKPPARQDRSVMKTNPQFPAAVQRDAQEGSGVIANPSPSGITVPEQSEVRPKSDQDADELAKKAK